MRSATKQLEKTLKSLLPTTDAAPSNIDHEIIGLLACQAYIHAREQQVLLSGKLL